MMVTRVRSASICLLAAVALSACGSGPADTGTYEGFNDALESGATCAELFEIRNEWDPKSSKVVQANEALREIGCYSSSSTRTDT
ncbi:hypothetical protein [Brachybacterium massiliense]|uniref:hypothetical protein n=1 Tax=Brachybacterium massiliense TaxID=1755098 RepID=UPI000B3BBFD6|nr:hypothetical protein [Brachybacterium massiliense]